VKNPRKSRVGRPRKFQDESRPVTVTLPERTLERLSLINADRARAIVTATELATATVSSQQPDVEVVEVAKGAGVILVGPNQSLRRIPWLRLVEVSPARSLLSLPSGTAVESLEIAILDLLDHLLPEEAGEREMLLRLRELIRGFRQEQTVSKVEILIVKTRRQG
jgi:hypothetical protein